MKAKYNSIFKQRQTGYSTLFIGVSMLFIMSLMAAYLTKSGILDIKTSANKARYTEALIAAEQNIDIGMAWLRQNALTINPAGWITCEGNAPIGISSTSWNNTFPISENWVCQSTTRSIDGINRTFYTAAKPGSTANTWLYTLIAQGQSNDGEASAIVRQGVYFPFANSISNAPPPPLMGAGSINLSGTFDVVTNSNGAGTNVPVSIWSPTPINSAPGGGSWATCHEGDFMQSGSSNTTRDCSSVAPLSRKSDAPADRKDIIQDALQSASPPGRFPDDIFKYVFGVDTSQYNIIKSSDIVVHKSNCDDIEATAQADYKDSNGNDYIPIIWVTGDCSIPNGDIVGSKSKPIILIVEPDTSSSPAIPGDFVMSAGSSFYGLLFNFSPATPANAGDVTANGNGDFYGSMISNDATQFGINLNGGFNLMFSNDILSSIQVQLQNNLKKFLTKQPGSWVDYLD